MDVAEYYSKSFKDFKENLNIAIPSLVGVVLTVVIMGIAGLIIIVGFLGVQTFISGIDYPGYVPNVSLTAVLISLLILIVVLILSLVINSFVYAATVGMAKKMLLGEKPGLDVAWEKGKKYFINILLVSIIAGIIAALLVVPLFLGIILFSVSYFVGLVITILGVLILIFGFITLAMAFLVVNQSIVIGKKSIMGSIKDSVHVLMRNKLQVFLVTIINFVIAVGISFIFGLIPIVGWFLNILAGILMTPYFVLVLTYLYMDVKDELPQ